MSSIRLQMRNWLNRQTHLPKDIDDNLIDTFVFSCYNDLEKAKVALDLFFTLRASFSEMLSNRDPLSPHMQRELEIVDPARYSISGNRTLTVWKINDPGLENYDYVLNLKLFYLFVDALIMDGIRSDGEILLIDVKDICPKFITTFNLSVARKSIKYCQDALPVRLQQVLLVNVPPFMYKIFAMIKPFIKKELIDMITFHLPGTDTINQFLSKDELPEDYGGNLEVTERQKLKTISNIINHREELMKIPWVANEKKEDETMDTGSFRTLNLD